MAAAAGTRSLAIALFGTPVRLFPRENKVLYLDRQPENTEPGDPLFVTIEYSVTTDGKVNRVGVIDKNVPNEQVRLMRQRVRATSFRPRIQDGELVPTEGLVIYQPYQVARIYSDADGDGSGESGTEELNDNLDETPDDDLDGQDTLEATRASKSAVAEDKVS